MRLPYLPSLPRRYLNNIALSDSRQTLNTVVNVLERRGKRRRLLSYPPVIQVEVTKRCNIDCFMCLRGNVEKKDLIPEVMNRLIPISRWAGEVKLYGYGEPLISKAFYALLARLERGRLTFFTNGKALTPRLLQRILTEARRPVTSIAFSIDGATPRTYEGIRRGSDFGRVTGNLAAIAGYRRKQGRRFPRTQIGFIAMRRNVAELPDLIRLAHGLGVSGVFVAHLVVWDPRHRTESLLYHPQEMHQAFSEAEKVAASLGVLLDLPARITSQPRGSPAGATPTLPECHEPWRQPLVKFNGDVQPCCAAPDAVMGNVLSQSFRSIWNGARFCEFRERVNSPAPPAVCRTCDIRYRYVTSLDGIERIYIRQPPAHR
jgi:radical SAM protein with 4Fe4S-binding SPASM domain